MLVRKNKKKNSNPLPPLSFSFFFFLLFLHMPHTSLLSFSFFSSSHAAPLLLSFSFFSSSHAAPLFSFLSLFFCTCCILSVCCQAAAPHKFVSFFLIQDSHVTFIKALLEPQSSVMRLERQDKLLSLVGFSGHVGLLGLWPMYFFLFILFSNINLYLKHNIKFRLYKINIMHTNKLFLYNQIK